MRGGPRERMSERTLADDYCRDHSIHELLRDLTSSVLLNRPADPIEWMWLRLGQLTGKAVPDMEEAAPRETALRIHAEYVGPNGVKRVHFRRAGAKVTRGNVVMWVHDACRTLHEAVGSLMGEPPSAVESDVLTTEPRPTALSGLLRAVFSEEVLAACLPVSSAAHHDYDAALEGLVAMDEHLLKQLFEGAAGEVASRLRRIVHAWTPPSARSDSASTDDDATPPTPGREGGSHGGKFTGGEYVALDVLGMGLHDWLGLPWSVDVATSDAREWARVVLGGAAVRVSTLDRAGAHVCSDFVEHPLAKKAGLSVAEVQHLTESSRSGLIT
ncbi:hypothetical protein T484DRAFT_1772883 [Baffinella frigidus]|nr:hypothetical protein T484DRAFT_1772883 [Cryptophyta sp. CCMP2293]